MPRNYDDILRDIGSFEPTNGSWLRLDELLTELWAAGVRDDALPTLFGVFERFPHDDGAETFWTLLRGIESLSFDYEQPLRESMSRQPSMMGAVMLGRLERSKG